MEKHAVSIVYVNYKTPALLNESIATVKKFTQNCTYEIIVVDNHSEDSSKEIVTNNHPDVVWIDAGYNSGFARGNNRGIERAKFDFVLIINSDTLLENDAISLCMDKYLELANKESIGLLGCKIISFDKKILPSVHSGFYGIKNLMSANPIYIKIFGASARNESEKEDWYTTNHFAAHISGAFMLFNKSKLNNKSLWLDEDYFLYAEDVDWCYRLQQHGFRCYFFADAHILHKDAASSPNAEKKNYQIIVSKWLFIFKAYGLLYFYMYMLMLRFNFLLDDILYYKSPNKTTAQKEAHQYRIHIKKLILKYGISIPFNFKKGASLSNQFLKYDKPN